MYIYQTQPIFPPIKIIFSKEEASNSNGVFKNITLSSVDEAENYYSYFTNLPKDARNEAVDDMIIKLSDLYSCNLSIPFTDKSFETTI